MYFFFFILATFTQREPNHTINLKKFTIEIQPDSITVNGFRIVYSISQKAITYDEPVAFLTITPFELYDETLPMFDYVVVSELSTVEPQSIPTDVGTHELDVEATFTPGETYYIWVALGETGDMKVFGPGVIYVDYLPSLNPSPFPSQFNSACDALQPEMSCMGSEGNTHILHPTRVEYCEQACHDHISDSTGYCCEYDADASNFPASCTLHHGSTSLSHTEKPDRWAMIISGSSSLRADYECVRGDREIPINSVNVCHQMCNDYAQQNGLGCCQWESETQTCLYYSDPNPSLTSESNPTDQAGLCDPLRRESSFPTPALLYPGRLTTETPVFEEFWCSNHTCYWNNDMKGIEWGYYTEHPVDCETCSEMCRRDSNCGGVECDTYCAWWKVGVCEDPDGWNGHHPTCRRKNNFNKVGSGLCAPASPMREIVGTQIDSVEVCFLACKVTESCSGVNVATIGPTRCQPVRDVPTSVLEPYDFDWFRDARFECYARPGNPRTWLIPSPAPTLEINYHGTPHPTESPTSFPTESPLRYEIVQWWDLHVILSVTNIPFHFTCEELKSTIWNAAMIIFIAKHVKNEDLWVEGCNMRRRFLGALQREQEIPLHIQVHNAEIKNAVHLELKNPYLLDFLNTNIHPLRVTDVTEPIVKVSTHRQKEPKPLSQTWRMVLFLLFGVLAGTTCFACYLWLCVKRRAYRRLRRVIRRYQNARRGQSSRRRNSTRRSSSRRGPSEENGPPPVRPVPPVVDEIVVHGGSEFNSEDEELPRIPVMVADPTEAGDDVNEDDVNL